MSVMIKKRRTAMHLTQQKLGERVGVSQSAVGMWESGIRTPQTKILLKLAEVLGCTVDDLVSDFNRDKNESEAAYIRKGGKL